MFVADELWGQWVRNHSAPIDRCEKEVGGHRSVSLGDLWPAGCWDCTGVDVVAAGFVLYWCFRGVV